MPAKERSPRYPSISLGEAIDLARRLYEKNGRTAVPAEVLAKVWGYKSASGPMRSKLGAVKAYGLLVGAGDKVAVSPRLITLVMANPHSNEYVEALRDAAVAPPIFEVLLSTHSEADENAIRYHLVSEKNFTNDGAKKLAETFRETMTLAGLAGRAYGDHTRTEPQSAEIHPDPVRGTSRTMPANISTGSVFRWPLGRDMSAEVILSGDRVTAQHLKRLRQYLELAEEALESDSKEAPE